MKGEKTLASGNVARYKVENGVTGCGVEAIFLSLPSAADLSEFRQFADTLVPPGVYEAGTFIGMGPEGKRAAKAAFESHLGRSSN